VAPHNAGREFRETVAELKKKMTLRQQHQHASEIRLPEDIDWHMLDKSKFFLLGAALFSGVSATLYPVVVLKTRQQVTTSAFPQSCTRLSIDILRREGLRGLYKGFTTSLIGTIPARALYMSTLEITKSGVGSLATKAGGMSEPAAAAIANAAAGLTASIAAQLVWTPVDVVSQRLMVQGGGGAGAGGIMSTRYAGGLDAFKTIVRADGIRGLYRGFGMSILTYAPSNALWWASYCITQRSVWMSLGYRSNNDSNIAAPPSSAVVVGVQGLSAACAGGVSALVTTPFDTIKTRLQVLGNEEGVRQPTVKQTVQTLVKEGGWKACYRGLGARWATMSMSATTMITTYEFLKRLSTKAQE
jgi:solute carrier family 25 protein 44